MSPKYLLLLACVFCVSVGVALGQKGKKCAAVGEYCLNHFDCCTGFCPSFQGLRCKYTAAQLHAIKNPPPPTVGSVDDLINGLYG